jgi:hypothetical protein
MEHHTQQMRAPLCIDHHQTLERLPTPCHTSVLPTNLQLNIASTNHQHIMPTNIKHSTQDHVDHLHPQYHNNTSLHLLDLELSQRTARLPQPTRPQAVTTHKTNYPLRPQLRPILSREYHNYRH